MSTVIAKNVQVGTSGTATDNFTIFQPATPDGTLRIGNGNTGITTSQVALNSSGNLGLGVTPSAWTSYKALQVGATGAASLASSNSSEATIFANAYLSSGTFRYVNSAQASYYSQSAGGHAWAVAASGTAGNTISFTQAMTLDASGNLGVGTTSPSSYVTNGAAIVSSVNSTQTKFAVVNPSSGTSAGAVQSLISDSDQRLDVMLTSTGWGDYGTIKKRSATISAYGNSGTFLTLAGQAGVIFGYGANPHSEAARIDSSGNVGIGTSSPAGKLHTVGSSGVYSLITQAPSTAGTYYHQLFKNDSTDIAYASSGGSVFAINTVGATPLVFGVNAIERARIDSSGNLLVGTTTAGISNSIGTTIEASGLNNARITVNHSTSGSSNDSNFMQFAYGGTLTGRIVQSSTSSVSYATSSDYRLKEDVQPMTGALAKVAALKPCTYKWKSNSESGQGFIAHELQEVVPDCVVGQKDAVDADGNPQYQGIDTSFLVATLTAAIQEQQAIILAQQTALTALTARVEALESN